MLFTERENLLSKRNVKETPRTNTAFMCYSMKCMVVKMQKDLENNQGSIPQWRGYQACSE